MIYCREAFPERLLIDFGISLPEPCRPYTQATDKIGVQVECCLDLHHTTWPDNHIDGNTHAGAVAGGMSGYVNCPRGSSMSVQSAAMGDESGRHRPRHGADAEAAPLILVTGLPGSGKTTVAGALAANLGGALLGKDTLKEGVFDSLVSAKILHETIAPPVSDGLSAVACTLLFAIAARFPASIPIVLEGDFVREEIPEWVLGADRALFEVHVECDQDVRLRRWDERARSNRHPVHVDDAATRTIVASLGGRLSGWER